MYCINNYSYMIFNYLYLNSAINIKHISFGPSEGMSRFPFHELSFELLFILLMANLKKWNVPKPCDAIKTTEALIAEKSTYRQYGRKITPGVMAEQIKREVVVKVDPGDFQWNYCT